MGRITRFLALCAALGVATFAQTRAREVAITFDDLPIAGVLPRDIQSQPRADAEIVAAVTTHHIPAIGFVNEDKLNAADGSIDSARVDLLRRWLDAGLELGNHGYSHRDLHLVPLELFEEDVIKGEKVTRPLMTERGRTLRFFRHPYLHTGRDLAINTAFEHFLDGHGYRVAPVTIDNDEYVFAGAYDRSLARGKAGTASQIADAYVPYMESKVEFFERNSRELFGREIPQVLLVHAEHAQRRSLRRSRVDVRTARLPLRPARAGVGGSGVPIG